MKIYTAALMTAALIVGATDTVAQTTQRFTASKANEYALIYTLPLTAFEVTLQARKTVSQPGPYANYSQKYLGIKPVLKESTVYELTGAEITQVAVADDDERWQVQFKSGSSVTMTLTQEGYPLAVNVDNVAQPIASAIKLQSRAAEPDILSSAAAREAVTEDMLRAVSTAKKAELAAERIMEIRQSRSELISGQADNMPKDGAALQLALDKLSEQEAVLTAMFTGTTSVSYETRTYSLDAPAADPTRVVVARISPVAGLLAADDMRGAPVYAVFADIVEASLPVNDKGVEKAFPKGGLAYRIPGHATVTITYDGKTYDTLRAQVAQLGVVFGLDPALFTDKKMPSSATFAPLTGAILELGTKTAE